MPWDRLTHSACTLLGDSVKQFTSKQFFLKTMAITWSKHNVFSWSSYRSLPTSKPWRSHKWRQWSRIHDLVAVLSQPLSRAMHLHGAHKRVRYQYIHHCSRVWLFSVQLEANWNNAFEHNACREPEHHRMRVSSSLYACSTIFTNVNQELILTRSSMIPSTTDFESVVSDSDQTSNQPSPLTSINSVQSMMEDLGTIEIHEQGTKDTRYASQSMKQQSAYTLHSSARWRTHG